MAQIFVQLSMVVLLLAAPSVARPFTTSDHIGAYNWMVEIEGINAGAFTEVSGLSSELEVIEHQNGDSPLYRKRPRRAKYGDITLKRGYQGDTTFSDWFDDIRKGQFGDFPGTTFSLVLRNQKGNQCEGDEACRADFQDPRWDLHECFPKSWRIRESDTENEMLEEIVLGCEGVETRIFGRRRGMGIKIHRRRGPYNRPFGRRRHTGEIRRRRRHRTGNLTFQRLLSKRAKFADELSGTFKTLEKNNAGELVLAEGYRAVRRETDALINAAWFSIVDDDDDGRPDIQAVTTSITLGPTVTIFLSCTASCGGNDPCSIDTSIVDGKWKHTCSGGCAESKCSGVGVIADTENGLTSFTF